MNLILCATPLQVLIAEKIIEQFPNECFYGVMLQNDSIYSEKYEFYGERLKKKCNKFIFYKVRFPRLWRLHILHFAISLWGKKKIKRVFLANINARPFQVIVSMLDKAEICTYDDGMANIDMGSFLYQAQHIRSKPKVIQKLLGVRASMDEIKFRAKKHYTIYPNLPNIVHSKEVVSLFPKVKDNKFIEKTIRIFLGQPIFEGENLSSLEKDNLSIRFTTQAIHHTKCEYYLPHPREKYHIDGVEYIHTPLILEDYLILEMQKNPTTSYELYSFFSTALINVKNSPFVEVFALSHPDIPEKWQSSYALLERIGVPILPLPIENIPKNRDIYRLY